MTHHYDTDKDFIFVVQPFTNTFSRILYPSFSSNGESKPVIFINDEVLVVAQGFKVQYCPTEAFQSEGPAVTPNGNASLSNKLAFVSQSSKSNAKCNKKYWIDDL